MPELTLKFSLPEEDMESKQALKGTEMYLVLCDLFQQIRSGRKHGTIFGMNLKKNEYPFLENLADWLNQEITERGLSDLEF